MHGKIKWEVKNPHVALMEDGQNEFLFEPLCTTNLLIKEINPQRAGKAIGLEHKCVQKSLKVSSRGKRN